MIADRECPSQSPHVETRNLAPFTSPSRTRSPTRAPRVCVTRGCASAPPAPRGPAGLLEQLMANSPKPPKWAAKSRETSVCEDAEDSVEGGQPKSHILGKWARGSKVGAQVRSAADLCTVGMNMSAVSGQTVAQSSIGAVREGSNRGSGASRGSASSARTLGANVRSASEGSVPSRSCPDNWKGAGLAGAALEERRVLQPLPPKPRFPPPDLDDTPQKPLAPVKKIAAAYEERWARRQMAQSGDIRHAAKRENSRVDSENRPPRAACSTLETPSSPGSDTVEEMRTQVTLWCTKAMHGPVHAELGPGAAEVGALLRRVETLLRASGDSLSSTLPRSG